MSTWAPVVYASTYKADFRLLTAPHGLARGRGREWLLALVISMLQPPERLEKTPRWSIFQDQTWRVFGVASMATDLVGRNDPMIRDRSGRPMYLFVGYASRKMFMRHFTLPPLCDTSLETFVPLYEYVRRHWDEERPTSSEEGDELAIDPGTTFVVKESATVQLNSDTSHIALWPDTRQERVRLWQAVVNSSAPMSLLLGFASQRYASLTPYLNGTSSGIKSVTVLAKST